MGWLKNRRTEKRESSLTDTLVTAIVNQAGGAVTAAPGATGALEACAGAYSRAMAAAEVSGGSVSDSITPSFLSMAARELIRNGEAVWLIEVDGTGARLIPCASWDVSGGYDQDSWRYQCSMAGPTRETTRTVAGASVLHFRLNTESARPWKGLSPLSVAAIAGRLDAEIAHAMGDEASGPRGSLLPVPKDGQDPTMIALRDDIKKLAGAAATIETTASTWDGDSTTSPRSDWGPKRLGAAWPASVVEGAALSFRVVASVCGVPSALLDAEADGTSRRESWRQFLHGSVAPMGRLLVEELRAKLDDGIDLDFQGLRASDTQGQSRAFAALVGGGEQPLIEVSEARRLTGLA